ncbi:MAG: M14 metallopeptidase family protein [Pyrinomonadaceae bacterium]
MHTRTAAALALAVLMLLQISAPAQKQAQHAGTAESPLTGRSLVPPVTTANIPAPEDVLGFRPGDDRKLASWTQTVDYFRKLDAASDRVRFEEIGKTTLGAPFTVATISAPENLARLDEYKDIQRQLADPRTLGANADRKAEALIRRGKTIVLITCGIHSTEVGSSLSSMLIAHRLASSNDAEVQQILRETIVLLVPSLNPDGVDIVKRWYDHTLGTPYEGTSPPELYHKYTGHDNNRDWYSFTQVETQLTVDKIHNVWHPQIVHDIHQQGAYGARLFLPPYMQPVEPNVPRQLVEGYTELGHFMSGEMMKAGFKGITWDSTYDAWTPARAYSHYHGGVRILSETASVNIATPITVKPDQLRAGEGYDARKATPNFPVLWPGGEWHLRDITNYMTTAAFELMTHAATNRERWLRRFYAIGREAERPRKAGELYGFKIKMSENSPRLLSILDRAGVLYDWLKEGRPVTVQGSYSFNQSKVTYPSGTVIVPLAQPYGGFARAMLERQHYPDLRDANNQPVTPYDVTAHTLSLLMNVDVQPVLAPFKPSVIMNAHINVERGDCALTGRKSVAIYKSHIPAIDEGWTRWALEPCVEFEQITDQEIRAGNFEQKDHSTLLKETKYDAIIIPDQQPRQILEGYRKGTMPEELTGGMGAEGVKALRGFVEAGGTLVCLNGASDFAIAQLGLPVRDITEGLKRTEYYAPGSILRTELDTSNPIAKGMPRESVAWVEDSPVFEFDARDAGRVHVIARYPLDRDPLLSGWLLGGRKLWGKSALLEVTLGKGRVYLFGFRPQYRGQSLATYPLLFNAITGAGR